MNRGRPRATGPFETHAEFVAAVLDRHDQDKSMRGIAQILKVSHTTIEKIIKENRSA
jgi:plasmid maintenance system antidote protein VapI